MMDAATITDEAEVILDAADAAALAVRALGGIGVYLRCPSARRPDLSRTYADIDLITRLESARALSTILTTLGYQPSQRFNALHGTSRMLFDRPAGVHIDVMVDRFSMSHRLDLRHRLAIDRRTLSVSDLVLTKLQVGSFTAKDSVDAMTLFLDHELTVDDSGVNVAYITHVLSHDWGWWRTATQNLELLSKHSHVGSLDLTSQARVRTRIQDLRSAIDAAPKSLRWVIRSAIGDRMTWREDPDEVGV